MIKIGNIVTFGETKILIEQFNVVDNFEDAINGIPTLLVGYSETKKISDNLDFLNRCINDSLYWTTSRTEDRYIFNKDLESFVNLCEKQLTNGFEYVFINPFEISIGELKFVLNNIYSFVGSYHIHKDMIYIYSNGVTYGYHGDIGDVYGIKTKRILDFITSKKYTQLSDSEIEALETSLKDIDYDQSQLIFLKQKFDRI